MGYKGKYIAVFLVLAYFVGISSCKTKYRYRGEGVNDIIRPKQSDAKVVISDIFYETKEGASKPEYEGGGEDGLIAHIEQQGFYPFLALESGIQGTIRLQAYIGKNGMIDSIVDLKRFEPILGEDAIKRVSTLPYVWKPSQKDGVQLESSVKIYISYRLWN